MGSDRNLDQSNVINLADIPESGIVVSSVMYHRNLISIATRIEILSYGRMKNRSRGKTYGWDRNSCAKINPWAQACSKLAEVNALVIKMIMERKIDAL